ncbi:hypothetical protein LSAT2_025207, partial [Lamellibrachia satsuma]
AVVALLLLFTMVVSSMEDITTESITSKQRKWDLASCQRMCYLDKYKCLAIHSSRFYFCYQLQKKCLAMCDE